MRIFYQLLFLTTLISLGLPANSDTLYILHTNNTNGALENCYCPDHPLGSLEKRTRFIDDFRKRHRNVLLFDAGDMWNVTSRLPLKDKLVSEAYSYMHYDAILPGDQEFTRPDDFFHENLVSMKADIVLSNIHNPQIPVAQIYKIIQLGQLSIGVLGVIGPSAFKYYPEEVREKMNIKSPEIALGEIIPGLKNRCEFIIVLSHQGLDNDRKLAMKGLGIDLIVGAHSQSLVDTTTLVNGTLISQAGKDGYYIGIIKLVVDSTGSVLKSDTWLEPMTLDMPDDARVVKLIEKLETETGIINRRKKEYLEK